MRVTCERNQLTAALGVVNRAVANRNTIQILNNVLIEAEGEELKLTATDLDIPGAELDDANEEIGEEDEENNDYSLGAGHGLGADNDIIPEDDF